jgi:hypothetical protein
MRQISLAAITTSHPRRRSIIISSNSNARTLYVIYTIIDYHINQHHRIEKDGVSVASKVRRPAMHFLT